MLWIVLLIRYRRQSTPNRLCLGDFGVGSSLAIASYLIWNIYYVKSEYVILPYIQYGTKQNNNEAMHREIMLVEESCFI